MTHSRPLVAARPALGVTLCTLWSACRVRNVTSSAGGRSAERGQCLAGVLLPATWISFPGAAGVKLLRAVSRPKSATTM